MQEGLVWPFSVRGSQIPKVYTSVWCETRHLLTYQGLLSIVGQSQIVWIAVVCSKPTVKQIAYVAKYQKFDYNFAGHKGQTQEWEIVNTGPRTWGLRTWGPGTRLCCTAAVTVQLLHRQSVLTLQVQTHGYVLYTIAMHTKGIIYNRYHYFKPPSDIFDPQSGLLSVLQSQLCTHKARVSCM